MCPGVGRIPEGALGEGSGWLPRRGGTCLGGQLNKNRREKGRKVRWGLGEAMQRPWGEQRLLPLCPTRSGQPVRGEWSPPPLPAAVAGGHRLRTGLTRGGRRPPPGGQGLGRGPAGLLLGRRWDVAAAVQAPSALTVGPAPAPCAPACPAPSGRATGSAAPRGPTPITVFCSWDHKVTQRKASRLQHDNIRTQLKVSLPGGPSPSPLGS